jgi:hypothetical protein
VDLPYGRARSRHAHRRSPPFVILTRKRSRSSFRTDRV